MEQAKEFKKKQEYVFNNQIGNLIIKFDLIITINKGKHKWNKD